MLHRFHENAIGLGVCCKGAKLGNLTDNKEGIEAEIASGVSSHFRAGAFGNLRFPKIDHTNKRIDPI